MSQHDEVDVHYEPDRDVVFDDNERPHLTWGHHPIHGNGWTLWYIDESGGGVEEHFIPGDLTDVDQAVGYAAQWLEIRFRDETAD